MKLLRNWTSSRARRLAAPGRRRPVGRSRRGQAAYTLIEALVSVAITSIVVVGLLGGVMTALKGSALQRRAATSEVVLRNFSEAFSDAPYVACGTGDEYLKAVKAANGIDEADDLDVDGSTIDITKVSFWNEGSTNPATFNDNCANAGDDTGIQKVEYSVSTANDAGQDVRKLSILKRFDGTLSDLYEQVPAGAVRCNVTADRDTFIDENEPGKNHGGEVSMDVAGTPGSQRQGLVHFDLRPDAAQCDDGKLVPVGMSVRSVEMRLYTWQVSGSPDCATACKHTLSRVTKGWDKDDEDTMTWGSDLEVDPGGAIPFKHGTGSGDLSPRHQIITDVNLLNQVSLYYQAPPENNRGWLIEQDCGASGADCESPAPGFRMRTREWPNASQRPTLSIVFQPNYDPGMQLQNVRYATCASIDNGGVDGRRDIVSIGCAGRPDQLWLHTPGSASGEGQFETITGLGCIQPNDSNSDSSVQTCDNGRSNQRWEIAGRAIKNQGDPSRCLVATSQKLGSAVGVQACNGSTEQQWIFGPPVTSTSIQAVRLTALGSDGKPTGSCADVEVRRGNEPYDRFAYEYRPSQTFPCLGPTRKAQQWDLGPIPSS
ncbi:ricin-type beta-trefoil lectin domain protein [Candidatus Microthrix parvicella]|uniref:ricin-type beta-trefoil lectin domain protein n=1 Tax=Candidatus Neomicrothrix parvicella TaxID=41950 RepID=UPI0004B1C042|nr:ricin-type beta-trefoil lectin domain protein [Candidatus Microthrix parvicella]